LVLVSFLVFVLAALSLFVLFFGVCRKEAISPYRAISGFWVEAF
jgi:hypothetical protein